MAPKLICGFCSLAHRFRLQRIRHARQGAMYVSVLLSSLIVSVTTLAGLQLLELRMESQGGSHDASRARQLSDSALSIYCARMNEQSNWRTIYQSGQETTIESFDGGMFWAVIDNDQNDLTNEGDRSVRLTVHSRFGQAGHARQAELEPIYTPAEVLNATIYVHGDFNINSGAHLTTDGSIWVNGVMNANSNEVQANGVRANASSGSGLVGGLLGTVNGVVTNVTDPVLGLLVPGDDSWMEEYAYIGTEIPYSSLPGGKIEKVVLSPTNNPFGSGTNEKGIYFIRCGGEKIEILRSRIEGTLVLFDCKSDSVINEQVQWTVPIAGMPAVVAGGSMNIKLKSDDLSESTHNTNFNPVQSPYRSDYDSDEDDFYPTQIHGPIIVTGDLIVDTNGPADMRGGIFVLGNLTQKSNVRLQRDDLLRSNPPPGLRNVVGMKFVNGTIHSVPTSL